MYMYVCAGVFVSFNLKNLWTTIIPHTSKFFKIIFTLYSQAAICYMPLSVQQTVITLWIDYKQSNKRLRLKSTQVFTGCPTYYIHLNQEMQQHLFRPRSWCLNTELKNILLPILMVCNTWHPHAIPFSFVLGAW